MTQRNNWETILTVAISQLIFSLSAHGAADPCSQQLQNIALYEGQVNTLIYFPAASTAVKWSNLATTDELIEAVIVNENNKVDPYYAAVYSFSSSEGVRIKNATTTGDDQSGIHTATAGLYKIECGGREMCFKVLVVREGPTCSCSKVGSSKVSFTCSSVYADSTYDPISAIFTLYANGVRVASDTPQRTNHDPWTWISKSTFTADFADNTKYECVQTFGIPTEIQDAIVAMNAPKFSENCSLSALDCETNDGRSKTTTARAKTTPKATAKATTKAAATATIKSATVTAKPATVSTLNPSRKTSLLSMGFPTTSKAFEPQTAAACSCAFTTTCTLPDPTCKTICECQADGTNVAVINDASVVKAQFYVKDDDCCKNTLVWGIVVTLGDSSRWLIHDPFCGDKKCEEVVVNASCMVGNWTLQHAKDVTTSTVGDIFKVVNSACTGAKVPVYTDFLKIITNLS